MNKHRFSRRGFLKTAGVAVPIVFATPAILGGGKAQAMGAERHARSHELKADFVIIGGGLGGCAAALAAARNGLRVILTEETDWLGGQLTQQAVPPDENKWIESFGASASYQALRTGIRNYYRRNYPLTKSAFGNAHLNPGNCWVSAIGCEPRVALAVIQEMLAPFVGNGQVRVLLNHKAVAADVDRDRIAAVRVLDTVENSEKILNAPFFADATELGDLLPLTRTDYAIGADAKADTGEPHAKKIAQPDNLQGFTFCFAMDHQEGEDHTIERPKNYSYWRDLKVKYGSEAPRLLFSFDGRERKKIGFDPVARTGYWSYRRIADRDLFRPGFYKGDITIVNWDHNDYSFGGICDVSESEAKRHIAGAKELSLSLLYWLQTDAPRPDGGTGWKGLRLRPDVVGTEDGLAKYPYIREGRRIMAEFTVLEQHVTTEARMRETGLSKGEVRAANYFDSVGIGSYHMDMHRTTRGDVGAYGSTLPFQIPLGALIPRRTENLLAACKNSGVTHLTNGCFRLHPVEWGIGEAAGALAAYCAIKQKSPREVRNTKDLLREFQQLLKSDGVRLEWPKEAGAL